jgi:prevent-host-death family protein
MDEIGSFDAKNRLSALLERVERGEEIMITRRGKPVAKLVPAERGHDTHAARTAVQSIRALAKEMKLGRFDWKEWKQYRDDGRR